MSLQSERGGVVGPAILRRWRGPLNVRRPKARTSLTYEPALNATLSSLLYAGTSMWFHGLPVREVVFACPRVNQFPAHMTLERARRSTAKLPLNGFVACAALATKKNDRRWCGIFHSGKVHRTEMSFHRMTVVTHASGHGSLAAVDVGFGSRPDIRRVVSRVR